MWDAYFRRWLDLVFWWLPKHEAAPSRKAEVAPPQRSKEAPIRQPAPAANGGAPTPTERSAGPAVKPTAPQPEKAVTSPVPDDLTVIKGIGPAVQNRLRALGITTFADLAAANPDRLMEQLKGSQPLSRGRVHHWTEAARERART